VNNQHVSKPLARRADGEKPPLNVILITLDDFGYELFIENLETLPNLKALKSESVFFENAFSIGAWTLFAFPGIIAGVYPYHFGIGIDRNTKAIDELLKECGYNTAFINELNPLLTPYFGYGMNADYQKYILNLSQNEGRRRLEDTLLRGGDAEKAKRALRQPYILNLLKRPYQKIDKSDIEWIRNFVKYCWSAYRFLRLFRLYLKKEAITFERRRKLYREFRNEVLDFINGHFQSPQFLWIHTVINHVPYLPPDYSNEFDTREVNYLNCRGVAGFVNRRTCKRLKRLYIESLKVTDSFIGDVVGALRMKGLLDNSIIIITADHGEEFMEEGYYGHTPESSSDRLLRVPLIFYCPNIIQNRSISAPVSTIDITPTICDMLGMRIPDSYRGLSLKEILLGTTEDLKDIQQWGQRSFFSESWHTESLLDRTPGYKTDKKIFTVRNGIYKLKVIQVQKAENKIVEKLELVNWVKNEKLGVKSNARVVEHLKHLLSKHIYDEGVFAQRIRNDAEKHRIKCALGKMRNKLQS